MVFSGEMQFIYGVVKIDIILLPLLNASEIGNTGGCLFS